MVNVQFITDQENESSGSPAGELAHTAALENNAKPGNMPILLAVGLLIVYFIFK